MTGDVRHFSDLKVWQKSHILFLDFMKDIETLNNSVTSREIIKQLVRSIGSIGANIAEGFNSRITKEYIRYLDIAKRTTAESENWFYKLRDSVLLKKTIADDRINNCVEISKMLQGLMNALSVKSRS